MQKIRKSVSLKTFVVVVSALIVLCAVFGQMAFSVGPGTLSEWYYTPRQQSTYNIGAYNSTHYYLENHTGSGSTSFENYDFLSTNLTLVEQYANGNMTSTGGLIYLQEVQWNTSLSLSDLVFVIETYQGQFKTYSTQAQFYIPQIAGDPTNLTALNYGKIWYDTVLGKLKFWDGTTIQTLPSVGGGAISVTLPYTYTVYKSGSTFYMEDAEGNTDFSSTNASAVVQNVLGNLTTGGAVKFRDANYPITVLHLWQYGNVTFEGESWNTVFDIRYANAGFNLSRTTLLRQPSFINIHFLGNGTSDYCITSAMPINTRIANGRVINCFFESFTKAGTVTLNITNPEGWDIRDNFMFGTGSALIQFLTYGYDSGNDLIEHNDLMTTANDTNAVRIVTLNVTDGNGSYKNLDAHDNHVMANHSPFNEYAFNFTTVNGTIGQLTLDKNRYEDINGVTTTLATADDGVSVVYVTNSRFTSQVASTGVNISRYSTKWEVSHNYFSIQATGQCFIDNANDTTENKFSDNIINQGNITANSYTYVQRNLGLNPLGVQTSFAKSGNRIAFYGATSGWSNNSMLQVRTSDVMIGWTGGTLLAITVYDKNQVAIQSYAVTVTAINVPYRCYVNISYSVAPTFTVAFN